MMTDIIMKGETSNTHKHRVESRPPLHRRRCSSKSVSGPEEMHSDTEQNVNNNEINITDGTAMSSSDNHMTLEQINVQRDDSKETRQLKELLLVHLDMITQQQEILMAKDRQIRALKSEKEALKCRLERMERRMSLLKQKSPAVEAGIGLGAPGQENIENSGSAPHVRAINFSNAETTPQPRGHKRKSHFEPKSLTKKLAVEWTTSPGQTGHDTGGSGDSMHGHHSPRRHPHLTPQHNKSAFGVRHFTRSPFNPLAECTTGNESDSSRTLSPTRGRGHKDEEPETGILDGVKERLRPVSVPQEEYFHRTDRMYYVPWDVPLSPQTRISPRKVQDEVKVPCFRVKPIQTGYSMEGTENLDDEIFAKRHAKPEQEEKRRKRWDMQRMREQRLYEKLQGKKQQRIAPIKLTKSGKNQVEPESPPESFIPDPDDVRFIEVCDNVPVSAFGYPVPLLVESEFDLPDYDLDKRESDEQRDEVKRSCRKKR